MMITRIGAAIVLVCSTGAQGQGGVPSDTLPSNTLPPLTRPFTRGPPETVNTPAATLGSDVTSTGVQIGSTHPTRTVPPITRGPPITSHVTPTFCCDALVALCELDRSQTLLFHVPPPSQQAHRLERMFMHVKRYIYVDSRSMS